MQRGRSVLKESDIEVHFFVRGKLRVRLRQCGFSASGLLSDCGSVGSVPVACCQTVAVWVQCQWPAHSLIESTIRHIITLCKLAVSN